MFYGVIAFNVKVVRAKIIIDKPKISLPPLTYKKLEVYIPLITTDRKNFGVLVDPSTSGGPESSLKERSGQRLSKGSRLKSKVYDSNVKSKIET